MDDGFAILDNLDPAGDVAVFSRGGVLGDGAREGDLLAGRVNLQPGSLDVVRQTEKGQPCIALKLCPLVDLAVDLGCLALLNR